MASFLFTFIGQQWFLYYIIYIDDSHREKKISKNYLLSDKQLQNIDSSSCGWFVAAFLRFMSKSTNLMNGYDSFIKLFKNNTVDNEAVLRALLR